MIWNPDIESDLYESAVVSYIAKKFGSMYGQFLSNPDDVEEVACAVERFLSRHSNSYFTRENDLVMLTSRALLSIGEKSASRRLFLQETGMIKLSKWDAAEGEAVWMLDIRQMIDRNKSFLEILFFRSLHIILEFIADVWDESNGRGILGLRHIRDAAFALKSNNIKKKKKSQAFVREVKALCARKLEVISNKRGWRYSPEVMILDV